MKQTRIIMGMPITVQVLDGTKDDVARVFDYFRAVDKRYSTYKPNSEISQINGGLPQDKWSAEMKQVLALCEETKQTTGGYFDIERDGKLDPSGLVKGWAIHNAANMLSERGVKNFFVEAGGDVAVMGCGEDGKPWSVGIRNPFNRDEIIKVVRVSGVGVATSGNYIRGAHIYNPLTHEPAEGHVASLSVIGPNIYEADRFATAAFAMGADGIQFIERQPGLEGYMVGMNRLATYTSGWNQYL